MFFFVLALYLLYLCGGSFLLARIREERLVLSLEMDASMGPNQTCQIQSIPSEYTVRYECTGRFFTQDIHGTNDTFIPKEYVTCYGDPDFYVVIKKVFTHPYGWALAEAFEYYFFAIGALILFITTLWGLYTLWQ